MVRQKVVKKVDIHVEFMLNHCITDMESVPHAFDSWIIINKDKR